jgi:hypothetical protein
VVPQLRTNGLVACAGERGIGAPHTFPLRGGALISASTPEGSHSLEPRQVGDAGPITVRARDTPGFGHLEPGSGMMGDNGLKPSRPAKAVDVGRAVLRGAVNPNLRVVFPDRRAHHGRRPLQRRGPCDQ